MKVKKTIFKFQRERVFGNAIEEKCQTCEKSEGNLQKLETRRERKRERLSLKWKKEETLELSTEQGIG